MRLAGIALSFIVISRLVSPQSNSPGGDELIGTIGYVYAQEAKQHSSRLFGMEVSELWLVCCAGAMPVPDC